MSNGSYRFCPLCATALAQQERYGALRATCPACLFVHFQDPKVAVIGLVADRGRVLLVQRAVDPARGDWGLPGGFMDAGEMPEEALVREFLEEVGLAIQVTELMRIFPMAGPNESRRGIVLAYRALPRADQDPEALLAQDDVMAVGWFGPQELPENLAFESTRELLRQWGGRVAR